MPMPQKHSLLNPLGRLSPSTYSLMRLPFDIFLLTKPSRWRFLIEPGLEQACLDGFCPQGSPPTVEDMLWATIGEQVSHPSQVTMA